jgi:ribonuclease D
LDQQLRTLGRETWVDEECSRIEEVRYTAPNLEIAYLYVKGSKYLDGRELAVLQSLVLFREEEARRQHRPPFFVLPDTALIFLATNPQADLSEVTGLGQTGLKRFGQSLRQALHNGITAPPINRPPSTKFVRISKEEVKRLRHLKEWRTSLGSSLSLDPSLLWPLTSLERIAKAPDTFGVEIRSDNIRHWQRDVVASSLQACLS